MNISRDIKTAENLSHWFTTKLTVKKNAAFIEICRVIIGKTSYIAAKYINNNRELCLYCLGNLPPSKKKHFGYKTKETSFYLAGWFQQQEDSYNPYHPFGKWFLLISIDDLAKIGIKNVMNIQINPFLEEI